MRNGLCMQTILISQPSAGLRYRTGRFAHAVGWKVIIHAVALKTISQSTS
jgi:hypothetical protein